MLESLNILDIIFLILSLIIILHSTFKGFLDEVFSTASWLISFVVAFLFYRKFASVLSVYIKYESFLYLISFLLLFLVCYIVIKILHYFISSILVIPSISSFDHALGFFLGVVKALVIITFIIFILYFQKIIPMEKSFAESIIVQIILPFIEKFLPNGLGMDNTLCLKI